MLIDALRKQMTAAMKAHKTVEKELLRTALGEITMMAHVQGVEASDALVLEVLKKLRKSTEETLKLTTAPNEKADREEELRLLEGLLPQGPSLETVVTALEAVREGLLTAKNDGQATGIAMKHLKSVGLTADGKLVQSAVAKLRTPSA